MMKINCRLLVAVLVAAQCTAARAQEVVAVLSSEQRAQRETYESFQAAFGKAVRILPLGEEVPDEAKIVLAFGGKAAVQLYPRRVTLIYALAPGVVVDQKTHGGQSIKIMMEPDADLLMRALTAIQPKLKRLAVLWCNTRQDASMERLVNPGAARGVEVSSEKLADAGDLPNKLRQIKGKVDAIWLPPDPLLISAHNFEIIKRFSYDNNIPFYAPTEGLAEQGATAAVSVSYEEMGKSMAGAVNSALEGVSSPAEAYSGRIRVSINRAAAAEAKLTVPSEALKSADKVYP